MAIGDNDDTARDVREHPPGPAKKVGLGGGAPGVVGGDPTKIFPVFYDCPWCGANTRIDDAGNCLACGKPIK